MRSGYVRAMSIRKKESNEALFTFSGRVIVCVFVFVFPVAVSQYIVMDLHSCNAIVTQRYDFLVLTSLNKSN